MKPVWGKQSVNTKQHQHTFRQYRYLGDFCLRLPLHPVVMQRFAVDASKGSRASSSSLCRSPSLPGLIALRRVVGASRRKMTSSVGAAAAAAASSASAGLPADYRDTFLATAHKIADAAGAVVRKYFR